jgi:hypothetical protein
MFKCTVNLEAEIEVIAKLKLVRTKNQKNLYTFSYDGVASEKCVEVQQVTRDIPTEGDAQILSSFGGGAIGEKNSAEPIGYFEGRVTCIRTNASPVRPDGVYFIAQSDSRRGICFHRRSPEWR